MKRANRTRRVVQTERRSERDVARLSGTGAALFAGHRRLAAEISDTSRTRRFWKDEGVSDLRR